LRAIVIQGLRNRRRRSVVAALACLFFAPICPGIAATFSELYTVSVTPDPAIQAPDQVRSDAVRRGMGLLLTRITGRQQASAYPEMREIIQNAERYLVRYAPLPRGEIRIGFSQAQLNQALTRLNMPIWGEERPATLLWIAADFGDGQRAELQSFEGPNAIRVGSVGGVASNPLPPEQAGFFEGVVREILTAADERGLPLVLPELDEEDRRVVRFADVWGGFEQLVERAAERYSVDAFVIARVSQTEFGPEVQWTVQRGDRRQTLTGPRIREGINWLADEYASEFTTIGDARLVWITVREIHSWSDYRVVEYLKSVSSVQSVVPESWSPTGELVLRVTARGDDTQLDNVLTLGNQLRRVANSDGLVYVPTWALSALPVNSP
jgi:hypothetical protein